MSSAGPPPPRDHVVRIEDCFSLVTPVEVAIAPDGSRVAWIEAHWDRERDRQVRGLRVADVRGGEGRCIDLPAGEPSRLRWSADTGFLFCLAEGPEGVPDEIWRLVPGTGRAERVVRQPGIRGFDRAGRAADAVYYLRDREVDSEDEWGSLRSSMPQLDYAPGRRRITSVWRATVGDERPEACLEPERYVRDLAVAPSGDWIALITAPDERMSTFEGGSRIEIWSLRSGRRVLLPDGPHRAEAASPFGWITSPVWSSDSGKLAFHVEFDGFPNEIFVAHVDSLDGEGAAAHVPTVTRVRRPDGVHSEGQLSWRPGTHDLLFLGVARARSSVFCLPGAGDGEDAASSELTPGDYVVDAYGMGESSPVVAIIRRGRAAPPDLHVLEPGRSGQRRLTELNPQVRRWKLPDLETVRWTSRDDTEVEGILELPPGRSGGDGPLPLVVLLHGGPNFCSKRAFRFWHYGRIAFAARGWALFEPNYRGSTGYGDAFVTDLVGTRGRLDVDDVLSGVDALVRRGIADPERMAAIGWSYGGYLVNCLITRTHRFHAASTGAGALDRVMEWCTMDTPGFEFNFSGGHPWEASEAMIAASPIHELQRIRTPTLVHTGSADERVPAHNGRALHRALHDYLGVPSQLVVYPGAAHGLAKRSHRAAKMAWDHAWFDRYVLGADARRGLPGTGPGPP